jgi:hypothetical protein
MLIEDPAQRCWRTGLASDTSPLGRLLYSNLGCHMATIENKGRACARLLISNLGGPRLLWGEIFGVGVGAVY